MSDKGALQASEPPALFSVVTCRACSLHSAFPGTHGALCAYPGREGGQTGVGCGPREQFSLLRGNRGPGLDTARVYSCIQQDVIPISTLLNV